MNRASALAKKLLTDPRARLSDEDLARLRPHIVGVEDHDQNPDGSFQSWSPSEKAVTPHPTCAYADPPTDSWDRAISNAPPGPIVLFGGGESTLRHDLKALKDLPVMGVNWTLKWFQPTYLHILDKPPFRTQVVENSSQQRLRSQVITSNHTRDRFTGHGLTVPVLGYEVKDDSCGKYPSFQLAQKGSDLFQHFPNSLGFALQAAVCLGYRQIVLMGFDFGGMHFFGDGRAVGTLNHYGAVGEAKRYLAPLLMAQAHYYALHGIQVVQVGPTQLSDTYPVVNTLEDALGRFA